MYIKHFITLLLTLAFSISLISQNYPTDSVSKEKIKELQFIVGNWQGKGWMKNQNGKNEFNQWETVEYKLDSTAIFIEGIGKNDGKTIHNAIAVLTYNKEAEHDDFTSFLKNGLSNKFKAEVIAQKLYWYPNPNVRYIIWENENDQWYETGEFKQGEEWSQYFEMTLDRTD